MGLFELFFAISCIGYDSIFFQAKGSRTRVCFCDLLLFFFISQSNKWCLSFVIFNEFQNIVSGVIKALFEHLDCADLIGERQRLNFSAFSNSIFEVWRRRCCTFWGKGHDWVVVVYLVVCVKQSWLNRASQMPFLCRIYRLDSHAAKLILGLRDISFGGRVSP